jgi:hypothetical protein
MTRSSVASSFKKAAGLRSRTRLRRTSLETPQRLVGASSKYVPQSSRAAHWVTASFQVPFMVVARCGLTLASGPPTKVTLSALGSILDSEASTGSPKEKFIFNSEDF